jgi:hypothetical protein
MQLAALQAELRRELATETTQNVFNNIKQEHIGLRQYPTVLSVLAVLDDQDARYETQDGLLRVLVACAQTHPAQRLWRQILLVAFLPGLMRIRGRTIVGEHEAQDVDAALWAAFFEVLHRYRLSRAGSVAKGLLRDTSKVFVRSLRLAQEARQHQRELIAYARRVAGVEGFDLTELQEPDAQALEPEERADIRAALARCKDLTGEDIDLLLATEIDGRTIPQYMEMRGLMTGHEDVDLRERKRLWQRRQRARQRVRHFFQKN